MQTSLAPAELPQPRRPLVNRIAVALGILLILILALLLLWGIYSIAHNHPGVVEALRDLMIIALAFSSCLFGIALLLIAVMVIRLVNMLEFEIKPILEQTHDTISSVRGTTNFVSQNVVKPVARATGFAMGFRRGVRVLFGDPRKNLPD